MRNLRIVIVDDESLVRLGIKSSVEWEKHGYEVVGEAENGQLGWEMIRRQKPDIVLLDICMPVMDGIAVLKKIREAGLECKAVVLSCHDDFQFVKEAMKNGSYDYLRKNDINSRNILDVLEEIRGAIEREQSAGGQDSGYRRQDTRERAASRQSVLRRLVTGELDMESCLRQTASLRVTGQGLFCAVFAVTHYQQVMQRYKNLDLSTFENNLINLSAEALSQRTSEWELFLFRENCYVLLLSDKSAVSNSQREERANALLLELCTVVKNYLNVDLAFGVCGAPGGLERLPAAFDSALYSLELRYFQPGRKVLCEGRGPQKTLSEESVKAILSEVHPMIAARQYGGALDALSEFIAWLKRHARENLDVDGIKRYFVNMLLFILLQEQQPPEDIVEELQSCETLEETERFLLAFAKGLEQAEGESEAKHYLLRAAMEYIQQNLCRGDISLDEIAEHLLISKSYLCRVFQKNLGVSVQQYIHTMRIDKAKEYLNDFHWKIYEIAEMTGFNSSTHFNIVFKKIMRCTPAEYRNGLKR